MKNKGSEWRKWDLHIHSPLSFLNNGYDNDWEGWIKKLVENEIKVIGLTNYFRFNTINDQSEIDIVRAKLKGHQIIVLPNLEFRLAQPNKDGDYINIHVLFSENVETKRIDDFLRRLKLDNDSYCSNLSSEADFFGATIAKKELEVKLNEDFKRHREYLIICCPNGYGGFRANYKVGRSVIVANIYDKLADFFFARSIDREYFLGLTRYEGCIAKAVLFCSDAHKIDDIGDEKFSWIKANATFEGLKQIIFEPDQRIKIQKEIPDYKEDKLIIEEVKFISSNEKFTSNPICLNENLNVVIGGKSSGKSILLYNIAKTLLADKDFFKKEELENKYDFRSDDSKFNFEIKTKGGFSQSMYRDISENSIIPEIKYISQNYLIKLAEPSEYKKGAALNKIIRDLIKEDVESQQVYIEFISLLQSNDRKREAIIDNYFRIKEKIFLLEQQIKMTSNTKVLEENIKSNTDKVADLNKSTGMTDDQILAYNVLQKQSDESKLERVKAVNDFGKIRQFNTDSYETLTSLKNRVTLLSNSLEDPKFKQYFDAEYLMIDSVIQQLNLFIQLFELDDKSQFKNTGLISQLFTDIDKRKNAIDNKLEPYLRNVEIKKQVESILKSISDDRASLQSIEQLSREIVSNKKALEEEKNKIFDLYEENVGLYLLVIENLKSRTKDLEKEGLKIQGIAKFNFKKFRESLTAVSDGRSASYNLYSICNNDKDSLSEYQLPILIEELKKIFSSLVETENFVLTGKTTRKNALKILLEDYFFDYWQIEYKNDRLGKMSTGKASFVILMLIVGLSKSKAPILIDQPEDNLDNRSITSDLVEYLKSKKLERQIILVTHNANIVVNADAENIIVANQKGQDDKATNSPYQFDYINGALENTFPLNKSQKNLLKSMGIREHVADVVEGGKEAFKKREEKYGFKLFR